MKRTIGLTVLLLLTSLAVARPAEDEAAATQLMNEYRDSFISLDAQRTSMHFNEPFMVVTAASTSVFATHAEFEASLKPEFSRLKSLGFARSEYAPLRIKALADGVVIASARTTRYKTDGSELETIGATYLLRSTKEGWRIAVVTPHPASRALPLQ